MNPNSWKEMVERTRELELSLGSQIKKVEENETETVVLQRRAMRASRSLRKGEKIMKNDFYPLRPCPEDAMDLMELNSMVGMRVSRDIVSGDYIKSGDLHSKND